MAVLRTQVVALKLRRVGRCFLLCLGGVLCRHAFFVIGFGIKGFENIRYGIFELVVFLGIDEGDQVVLEFFSVPDDFQVQFFHFLSKFDMLQN